MDKYAGKIILKGLTNDGRKFRPSDWAQRLTTAVASYSPGRRTRRAKFHPGVTMITIDGINCVTVDRGLEQQDPMLFNFLMNFGKGNNLEILDGEELS